jgi:two-component system CheB/CheR fusion protein
MSKQAESYRVVCLGGSAGGLQAYLTILRDVPADTGMAFVVAPHRGIEHAALLPQLLAGATTMPVLEVTEGMRIAPNKVFIMPPRQHMELDRDVFRLSSAPPPYGWPKTINAFLYSLAETRGNLAVAVILSGMDSDGVAALSAIKTAGGITFAQADPAVDSMPRHAVESGNVDYLLPAAEIGPALTTLAHDYSIVTEYTTTARRPAREIDGDQN